MAGPNFGQSAASYLEDSTSPSFSEDFSSNPAADFLNPLNLELGTEVPGDFNSFADAFSGTDKTGDFSNFADALSGSGALAGGGSDGGWTFICAPEDVSWNIANAANRVDIFGTNNPPVVAGTKGMRDLTLGNALVEGFTRNVTIEGKVAALEKLMSYSLNTSDGFVSVPVYQVWANSKSYGGSQAYFIIKDVRVKESMRDLQGNATRAYVDISLMQVPAYQINSGRDQASKSTAVGAAGQQSVAGQANANVAGAKGGSTPGAPGSNPSSGPNAPKPAASTTKPPPPPANLGQRVKVQGL
jgi:hypothetical protein